ncbi:MAG: ATP-binding protein [Candidatus Omnitrophota bacterium]
MNTSKQLRFLKTVKKVISFVLIGVFFCTNSGFSQNKTETSSNGYMIVPPLATNPPCEVVRNGEDGKLEIKPIAEQLPGAATFQNRWAYIAARFNIATALKSQISEYTLKHDILEMLKTIEDEDEMFVQNIDFENLKEIRDEFGKIIKYSVPLKRDGMFMCNLVYSLKQYGENDQTILLPDGTTLYLNMDVSRASKTEERLWTKNEELVRIVTSLASFDHPTSINTDVIDHLQILSVQYMQIEVVVLDEEKLLNICKSVKKFGSEFGKILDILARLSGKAKMLISGETNVNNNDILDWKKTAIWAYEELKKYELQFGFLKKEIIPHLMPDDIEEVEKFCRYLSITNSMVEDRIFLMNGIINDEIFDLKEICDSLFKYLTVTARDKQARSFFKITTPDKPVWIRGNRLSIISLICNLADNAYKYSKKKHNENACVSIEIVEGKKEVAIIVRDNGSGMTQQVMESLRKPFFTEGGTGIGTTEVSLTAKSHGGAFEMESPSNSGAQFTVYLPMVECQNEILVTEEKNNFKVSLPAKKVRELAERITFQIRPLWRRSKAIIRGLSPETGLTGTNLKIFSSLDIFIAQARDEMKQFANYIENTKKCASNKNLKILLSAINNTFAHFVNNGVANIQYIKMRCVEDNVLRQKDIEKIENELDAISRAVSALGVLPGVRLEEDLETIYVPGSQNVGVFPVVMDSFTLDSKIKFSQKEKDVEDFSVDNKWYIKVNFTKFRKSGLDRQYIYKLSAKKQETLRELRRIAEEHILAEKDEEFLTGLLDFFMFKNTEMIKASDIFFSKEWRKNIVEGLILLVDNFNAEIYGEEILGGDGGKFIKEAVRFDSEYFTNSLAHTMRPYYALLKLKENLNSKNDELEELILEGKKINADFKLFYSGIIKHYQYYCNPHLSLYMINLTIRLLGQLSIFNERSWIFLKEFDSPKGCLREVSGLNSESIYRDKLKAQKWLKTIKIWKKNGVQDYENEISYAKFRKTVNKWAKWWKKKNIDVKVVFAPGRGRVHISRADLIYLLENLFTNAVDAKRAGLEFKFEIELSKMEIDGCAYVVLKAKDNGCGMTKKDMVKIRSGDTFSTKGTSLGRGRGLAIVFDIAKNAGGKVKVMSEQGKGTTFAVYVPINFAREQDINDKKKNITPIQAVKEYTLELKSILQPICDKMADIIKNLSPEGILTEAMRTKLDNLNKCVPEIIEVLKTYSGMSRNDDNKNFKILKQAVNATAFDRIRSDLNSIDPIVWKSSKTKKFEQEDLEMLRNMNERWLGTINALCSLSEVKLTVDLNYVIVPKLQRESNTLNLTRYKTMESLDVDMETVPAIDMEESTKKELNVNVIISEERVNARMLKDAFILTQEKWNKPRAVGEEKPAIVFALGTSWIKGYEKGNEQYNGLNPLISSIRGVCAKKGITFVLGKDEDLINLIREENIEGLNSKIIILAGRGAVESKTFENFKKRHNAFLAGVDNRNMNEKSYVRIVQMLRFSLYLAFGKKINTKGSNIAVEKENGYYLFIPEAEPAKYEELRMDLYKAQISV